MINVAYACCCGSASCCSYRQSCYLHRKVVEAMTLISMGIAIAADEILWRHRRASDRFFAAIIDSCYSIFEFTHQLHDTCVNLNGLYVLPIGSDRSS